MLRGIVEALRRLLIQSVPWVTGGVPSIDPRDVAERSRSRLQSGESGFDSHRRVSHSASGFAAGALAVRARLVLSELR